MSKRDKVALVTGGGNGIGKAVCQLMARQKIKVAVNDIDEQAAQYVVNEISQQGGIALSFQADIGFENEIRSMIDRVISRWGHVDYLVNNAGISEQLVPIIEQDTDKWQRLMDIHLKATYICSKEIAKTMLKIGFGRIINMSSIAGLNGFPMRTGYGTAKSAIIMLTKVLALEWASANINVNAVAPGYIQTEMVDNFIRQGKMNQKEICNRIPMKRLGTPEEIADIVLFLCSDTANYITGQTIVVDGGFTAYGYI
ncbi:MAG: 3-oxoacyl-ACP reductase FabG [Deltaproteobacteria bacterium]|nr:3-oxoacyl-ACP reductase FabG [Deltaproteobacteria bacterium]